MHDLGIRSGKSCFSEAGVWRKFDKQNLCQSQEQDSRSFNNLTATPYQNFLLVRNNTYSSGHCIPASHAPDIY